MLSKPVTSFIGLVKMTALNVNTKPWDRCLDSAHLSLQAVAAQCDLMAITLTGTQGLFLNEEEKLTATNKTSGSREKDS